ncbi:hypothetical protein SDC9_205065 [bioreactor metagenome]|uniref:Uncharacterized protein n=1 Tax=bioreactor metagenome TaxID=1076179 RepID=A0A645J1A3_9ZZZZ
MNLYVFAYVVIQIGGRIGKRCEDDNLLIALVDRVLDFSFKDFEKLLKLTVMLRRNVGNHEVEQFQYVCISYQTVTPGFVIHICKVDLNLSSD